VQRYGCVTASQPPAHDGEPRPGGRDAGWEVSENTVAKLMAGQCLAARRKKKRKAATRPGKGRWRAQDLVKRDFPAGRINQKWYGDGTEIPPPRATPPASKKPCVAGTQ
jgi:hypothetical protein